MTIYRNWIDSEGNKAYTLDSKLIELNIPEGNGWIIDEQSLTDTRERMALYYTKPIATGKTTTNIIDTLRINPSVNNKASSTAIENTDGSQTITTSYAYNGCKFNIKIEVDAVQTHHAEEAILSAWGRKVNIAEDGTLSLQ